MEVVHTTTTPSLERITLFAGAATSRASHCHARTTEATASENEYGGSIACRTGKPLDAVSLDQERAISRKHPLADGCAQTWSFG